MLRDRRPEVYGPLTASDEDARNLFVSGTGLEDERVPLRETSTAGARTA
jgi:hypothetical protein